MKSRIRTLFKYWLYAIAVYAFGMLMLKLVFAITGINAAGYTAGGTAILALAFGLASWNQLEDQRTDDIPCGGGKHGGTKPTDSDKSTFD